MSADEDGKLESLRAEVEGLRTWDSASEQPEEGRWRALRVREEAAYPLAAAARSLPPAAPAPVD